MNRKGDKVDIAKKKKASIRSGKKKAGPGYKSKIKMKKAKSDYYDFNLVAVIILIMCFGLIMLTVQALIWLRLMKGTICSISKNRQCTVLAVLCWQL